MSDGQKSQNLQQLPQLRAKTSVQIIIKVRTFQAENGGMFKNSQLQTNFTGCYIKKSVQ